MPLASAALPELKRRIERFGPINRPAHSSIGMAMQIGAAYLVGAVNGHALLWTSEPPRRVRPELCLSLFCCGRKEQNRTEQNRSQDDEVNIPPSELACISVSLPNS